MANQPDPVQEWLDSPIGEHQPAGPVRPMLPRGGKDDSEGEEERDPTTK